MAAIFFMTSFNRDRGGMGTVNIANVLISGRNFGIISTPTYCELMLIQLRYCSPQWWGGRRSTNQFKINFLPPKSLGYREPGELPEIGILINAAICRFVGKLQ